MVLGVGKGVLFREVSSVQECPHKERGSTVHTHTHTYSVRLSHSVCVSDVDECLREGSSYPCHSRADCNNTMGSYYCTCQTGFSGDGSSCDGKTHKHTHRLQMAIS